MNDIKGIKFVYNPQADICLLKAGQFIRELTIKGPCEYQGLVNGTWFQIDDQINHWISFRKSRFYSNSWEAFYKCVQGEKITYYRRVFYQVKETLTLAFSERDEWIKDQNGKWRSKF